APSVQQSLRNQCRRSTSRPMERRRSDGYAPLPPTGLPTLPGTLLRSTADASRIAADPSTCECALHRVQIPASVPEGVCESLQRPWQDQVCSPNTYTAAEPTG